MPVFWQVDFVVIKLGCFCFEFFFFFPFSVSHAFECFKYVAAHFPSQHVQSSLRKPRISVSHDSTVRDTGEGLDVLTTLVFVVFGFLFHYCMPVWHVVSPCVCLSIDVWICFLTIFCPSGPFFGWSAICAIWFCEDEVYWLYVIQLLLLTTIDA